MDGTGKDFKDRTSKVRNRIFKSPGFPVGFCKLLGIFYMRFPAVLILMLAVSLTAPAQTPKNSRSKKIEPPAKTVVDEKAELEKALGETDAAARIAALEKFIENFPQSEEIARAKEHLVTARAELAEANLAAGDAAAGIELLKAAVRDAPAPMPEKLFTNVILKFPTVLFFGGERAAAFDVAEMIEEKIGNADVKQLLGLATFYIGIENATNARRLAQKAIELAPEMPLAYQTLGIANRLGFRLDEAAAAYAKALALDPESAASKRSLAEMKRANGKADEAVKLYREILEKDPEDAAAKTGLILALFETGNQSEAETLMQASLEAEPNNLPLLVGAAYFYAARGDGEKAVDLAQKALAIEPRYTWANIALARGYLAQQRPLDAEKVLLAARSYGNFPTLDYEIASARLQAGFYREAADELRKNFASRNGVLETYLGNRVGVEAEDFLKLLSLERRAAIFSFEAADTPENAERLKALLEFSQQLNSETADEAAIDAAADNFIKGDDKMKIHRQLFVAGRLLDKKKNLPKVIELTRNAVAGVDTALDVPNAAAAILADELYEARKLAISRGELIIVPEVPRQTLSVILRGRIEELSGWTLYQQDKTAEAIVRLKRAVSVLPEDSSWWRSSTWRLGAALEADGKPDEALENYIKSYKSGEANPAKYIIIETLYQKVNGSIEGLEEKIGKRPEGISDTIAQLTQTPEETPVEPADEETSPAPEETSPAPPVEETNPETAPTPAAEENPSAEVPAEENTVPADPETENSDAENSDAENPNVENSDAENPPAQIEDSETPTPEISPSTAPTPEQTPELSSETAPLSEPVPTPETPVETTPETPAEETTVPEQITDPTPEPEIFPLPEPEISPAAAPDENQITETISDENEENPPLENPDETVTETVSENTEEPPAEASETVAPTAPEPETVPASSPEIEAENEEPAVETETPQPAKENPADIKTATKPDTASNSIFEPIVISVPKKEAAEKTESKTADPVVTRPRVIIEDRFKTEEAPVCELVVSQESVWLLNDGGSLGVLVGFAGPGDAAKITAVSSSPEDIEVSIEPEIGTNLGRAFFILKSVSTRKGAYTVTFNSPCGKKEVQVRVR